MTDRIVALVDMDCFYVQVEERLDPSLRGRPCAVVQYNAWKGGGIIAVNYEARDRGVPRHIRGDDAKKACPEIILVRVPEVNGKADLTKYRNAGSEVIKVISRFGKCVERASVDEAYIDLTAEVSALINKEQRVTADQLPTTFVVGADDADRGRGVEEWLNCVDDGCDNMRLAFGATVVEKMRAAIFAETGFKCSAGIAHNKVLSKLSCGLHKPNQQTILPHESVEGLFSKMKVNKIRNLGGKFGEEVTEKLKCETMGDVAKYSLKDLQKHFDEKSSLWLYEMAKGLDHEPVQSRQLPQSIGCSKNFPGKSALATKDAVKLWLGKLAAEIEVRLAADREKNNRMAKVLSVHANGLSRSFGITSYVGTRIASSALTALEKLNTASSKTNQWSPALYNLGMSAGKFQSFDSASTTCLQNFFTKTDPKASCSTSHVSDDGLQSTIITDADTTVDVPPSVSFSEIDSGHFDNSIHDKDIQPGASGARTVEEITTNALQQKSKTGFFASRSGKTPSVPQQSAFLKQQETNRRNSITDLTGIRWEGGIQEQLDSDSGVGLEDGRIDPEVFANLPADIQQEIRSQLLTTRNTKSPSSSAIGFTRRVTPSNLPADTSSCSTKIKLEGKSDDAAVPPLNESNIQSENSLLKMPTEYADHSNGAADLWHERADGASTSNGISDNVIKTEYCGISNGSSESPELFDEAGCSGLQQHNVSSEDQVLCVKCDKFILAWDLPEHNDFHVALELEEADKTLVRSQLRENRKEGTAGKTTPNKASGGGNGVQKRKGRPLKKNEVTAPAKRTRSISTFFVKRL